MITRNALYLILLVIGIEACQKDIIVQPDSSYRGQLFIEGILFPGQTPRIFISHSLPFFDRESTPQELFARNAEVTIFSSLGKEVLQADSTFDKFRCRWTPFYRGKKPVAYGQTYELTVTYRGKSYSASTTIDQPRVTIDTIEYIEEFFDVYGGHDGVVVRFQDAPGSGNFYRFQMNRMIDTSRKHAHVLDVLSNDCTQGEKFLVSDFGRTIYNDDAIDGRLLELLVEVTFEYREGDTAYVSIQSLDRKSAEFYRDLDEQLESILNPFVEPVFLDSKIDGAMGVFGSAVLSDSVLFVYPQDNP